MKIKAKLTLWVSFLFLLIIILIAVGVTYTNQISNDTQNILAENYNTIDYSRKMLIALDEIPTSQAAIDTFQLNLMKQQNNITERSEQQLTTKLTLDFEKLKTDLHDSSIHASIRSDLANIMLLNMQAIQRKSEIAKQTAKTATIMISLTGTFCFMLAFSLLLNLPSNIANPIKELTESVKEIAAKNYTKRVHFEQHNEFGELAQSFNVMAEKLQEYNNSNLARLMQEKKRIETLINNMHDPVIGLDENRRFIFINNEALKISGLKQEDVVGKDANEIALHNDLIRSLIQELTKPGSAGIKQNEPLKIFADNKESFFEKEIIPISIIPTAEKQSRHIGDVIILQNITPFKELDFAKSNFIATISHELKTPISSIMMSLHLLQNEKIGQMNSDQAQLIHGIQEDSERLLKITEELLNMTQVETGKIKLTLQSAPVKEIIQYAADAVKVQADQKKVTIELDCPNGIPNVNADREKTAWVLTNFLSNAIRYSYENSNILLTAREAKDQVQISVTDYGIGIDEKYQHKIFDRYFQVPGSSKSGTGLGLAISKEFVEAQGGEISLQSELGKGSTFTITLKKSTA